MILQVNQHDVWLIKFSTQEANTVPVDYYTEKGNKISLYKKYQLSF